MKKEQKSVSKNKLEPLGDRVLIRPKKNELGEKTKSGIYIPESVEKEKPAEGMVIAVGPGKFHDGKIVPMGVSVGDEVIFSKYSYEEVKVDGEDLYILKEENIFAVIK
jgi:chaperonin GroES